MNDICADELDRNAVAWVDDKFRRGIRKLPRVNPKRSLLRRDDRNWSWSKSHDQSGQREKEEKQMRTHS
jgi:hypothetical protein